MGDNIKNSWQNLKIFLISKIPNWGNLYTLSHSKAVKSSYFWFIFVPIAAKFLTKLNKPLEFTIFGMILNIKLELPFSWQFFFWGATFIAIGNIIYTIRCPEIVKNYKTYFDFKKEGKESHQLIELFIQTAIEILKTRNGEKQLRKSLDTFDSNFCRHELTDKNKNKPSKSIIPLLTIIDNLKIEPGKLQGVFWYIRNMAQNLRTKSLFFSLSCYGAGFLFMSIVFYENIKYVWRLTTIF